MPSTPSSTHSRILAVVRRIPRGRVATYGQVAALAGLPRQPRLVGYALHALPSSTAVPWHRVINAKGMISIRSMGGPSLSQRLLLEREGVTFDAGPRVIGTLPMEAVASRCDLELNRLSRHAPRVTHPGQVARDA